MARTSIILNSGDVTVIRGTLTQDAYNSDVYDWSTPTVVATGKGTIQNYLATEDDVDRQTTTEGWRLISDDPALFNVIEPTDRIQYQGVTMLVDSPAQHWYVFNKPHHIEVFLKKVDG